MDFKNEGNALFAANNVAGAINCYTQGIEKCRDNDVDKVLHILFANRSQAHLSTNMVDQAVHDASEAIKVDPTYVKARFRRAAAVLALPNSNSEQLSLAVEDMETALHIDPTVKDQAVGNIKKLRLKLVELALKEKEQKPESTRRISVECIAQSAKGGKRPLYPCSPGWINDPQRFVDELQLEKQAGIPQTMAATMASTFISQRKMDLRWRLLGSVDMKKKLPKEEVKCHFEKAGFDMNMSLLPKKVSLSDAMMQGAISLMDNFDDSEALTIPVKCDYCHNTIEFEDPPECACGTVFCSVKCHADAHPDHKKECDAIADNNELALFFTEKYWESVCQGRLPMPACLPLKKMQLQPLRDFGAEWKYSEKRKKWASLEEKTTAELDFYFSKEKPYLEGRLTALQDEARKYNEKKGGEAKMAEYSDLMLEEMMLQLHTVGTPDEGDSLMRLIFKRSMLDVFTNFWEQMNIATELEQRMLQLQQLFDPLIEEGSKKLKEEMNKQQPQQN